jgi:hypothetical protein
MWEVLGPAGSKSGIGARRYRMIVTGHVTMSGAEPHRTPAQPATGDLLKTFWEGDSWGAHLYIGPA